LEQGLSDLPGADPEVRAQLEAQAARIGWARMHQRLAAVDAESAARIHPNDPQRIQRALEVYELTGAALSELCRRGSESPPDYRFLKIVLAPPEREVLHQRIERRIRVMLEQGFLDEVERLRQRGDLAPQLPALRAVGYRQAWMHLQGQLSADEWVERAVVATRQYARRQLTWLRAEPDAHWVDPLGAGTVAQVAALIQQAGAAAS
jgi:tRNA dimethylallyltransferase